MWVCVVWVCRSKESNKTLCCMHTNTHTHTHTLSLSLSHIPSLYQDCHDGKAKCDANRPCHRCVAKGKAELCRDMVQYIYVYMMKRVSWHMGRRRPIHTYTHIHTHTHIHVCKRDQTISVCVYAWAQCSYVKKNMTNIRIYMGTVLCL